MPLEEEYSMTELEKAQKFYDKLESIKQTYYKRPMEAKNEPIETLQGIPKSERDRRKGKKL